MLIILGTQSSPSQHLRCHALSCAVTPGTLWRESLLAELLVVFLGLKRPSSWRHSPVGLLSPRSLPGGRCCVATGCSSSRGYKIDLVKRLKPQLIGALKHEF